MPNDQNEKVGDLSTLEKIALDNVEKNVRSARNILLTLTVICAFLFAVIFETSFGWPNPHPSGSHEIFVNKITKLAEQTESARSENLTTLERGICSLAADHYRAMAADPEAQPVTLRLRNALKNTTPRVKERYLAVFAQSIRQYEELLKKAYENYMENTLESEKISDAETPGSKDEQRTRLTQA